jgi:hypothetical protein
MTQLQALILAILQAERHFMTSYQILEALPPDVKQSLIDTHGASGKNAGHYYSAATRVAQVTASLVTSHQVECVWTSTVNVQYKVNGAFIEAGNRICAQFRVVPGQSN